MIASVSKSLNNIWADIGTRLAEQLFSRVKEQLSPHLKTVHKRWDHDLLFSIVHFGMVLYKR